MSRDYHFLFLFSFIPLPPIQIPHIECIGLVDGGTSGSARTHKGSIWVCIELHMSSHDSNSVSNLNHTSGLHDPNLINKKIPSQLVEWTHSTSILRHLPTHSKATIPPFSLPLESFPRDWFPHIIDFMCNLFFIRDTTPRFMSSTTNCTSCNLQTRRMWSLCKMKLSWQLTKCFC